MLWNDKSVDTCWMTDTGIYKTGYSNLVSELEKFQLLQKYAISLLLLRLRVDDVDDNNNNNIV